MVNTVLVVLQIWDSEYITVVARAKDGTITAASDPRKAASGGAAY